MGGAAGAQWSLGALRASYRFPFSFSDHDRRARVQIEGVLNGTKRVWSQRNGEVGWFMLDDLVKAIQLMAEELRAKS